MSTYWNTGGGWLYGVLGLTPMEKWRAARFGGASQAPWWASNVVVFSALAVLVAVLVCLVLLRERRGRRARSDFRGEARKRRITDREFRILAEVVKRAKLKALVTVFTTDVAFDRGAAAYLQSGRFARLDPEDKDEALELVESLREKMDFSQAEKRTSFGARTTRRLRAGTALEVSRDGSGESFEAAIASTNAVGMAIQLAEPVRFRAGEKLRVQFTEGGRPLEFDTAVVRRRQEVTVLSHSDRVRPANRRRFARISVGLPGRAALPREDNRSSRTPRFRPAQVLEVAGPGLRLASTLSAQPKEKVLLEIELPGGRVLRRTGVIRRVVSRSAEENVYAVELLALADHEEAELVRVANRAAVREHAEKTQAPEEAPKTPAAQQVT